MKLISHNVNQLNTGSHWTYFKMNNSLNEIWREFNFDDLLGGINYLIFNSETNKIETYICSYSSNKSRKKLVNFESREEIDNFDNFVCYCDISSVLLKQDRNLELNSYYLIDIGPSQHEFNDSYQARITNFAVISKYLGDSKFILNNGNEILMDCVYGLTKIPEIPFKYVMKDCLKKVKNENL